MEQSPETDLLLERVDDQQVVIETLQDKLHRERAIADRLAAALYARGFTAAHLDSLTDYEALRRG